MSSVSQNKASSANLSEQDRDAVDRLQLFARGVVEGVTGGRHRSPFRGSSVEFKEHREYVHGDELRTIDWKLYGKSDRLFIRQYEDETNLRATIVLDQSGSMKYSGKKADGLTKHEYAVRLAACMSMLLLSQQDAVGLSTVDTDVQQNLPPRSNMGHMNLLLRVLAQSHPGGETSLGEALQRVASKVKRRGMLILISDCFDKIESLSKSLAYFRHQGHDVILFQIWDQDELEFPFRNRTEFRSLENASKHLLDPGALRKAYLKRVEEFREQLETETSKLRIDLISCTTDEPCGEVIKRLVAKRQRGKAKKK